MEDDLLDWIEAVTAGRVAERGERVRFTRDSAVVVIGAAPGYPERPEKGIPVPGPIPGGEDGTVFYAGAVRGPDGLVTAGGRVFGAVGWSHNLGNARAEAYRRLREAGFAGMHARTDIGEGVRPGGAGVQ
jgi:phosphoribosylamine--glycine ligase